MQREIDAHLLSQPPAYVCHAYFLGMVSPSSLPAPRYVPGWPLGTASNYSRQAHLKINNPFYILSLHHGL